MLNRRRFQGWPGGTVDGVDSVFLRPCDAHILLALLTTEGGSIRVIARYAEHERTAHVGSMMRVLERIGFAVVTRPTRKGRTGTPRHVAPTPMAWAWARAVVRGDVVDRWCVRDELRELFAERGEDASAGTDGRIGAAA